MVGPDEMRNHSAPDLTPILAVAVGGIIQVAVTDGPFTLWNLMTGTILVCVLSTYRFCGSERFSDLAALATVWGLTLVIAFGYFVQCACVGCYRTCNGELQPKYYLMIWLVVSTVAYVPIWILAKRAAKRAQDVSGLQPPTKNEPKP
jgi:hypothetical protein